MASKMYILLKGPEQGVDVGHAVVAAAHASLSGYLTFLKQEHSTRKLCHGESPYEIPTVVETWAEDSFVKVLCKVTAEEFLKAKAYGVEGVDFRVMTESSLGGIEVAIVFKPRNNWEPFFKSLPLYK